MSENQNFGHEEITGPIAVSVDPKAGARKTRKYEHKLLKEDGLKFTYEIKVHAEDLAESIRTELDSRKQTYTIAGFRPGHAPDRIIQKKFGEEVATQKIQSVVQDTLLQFFEDTGVKPAMPPQVNVTDHSRDARSIITFILDIETYPETPDVDFTGIDVTVFNISVTSEDLEKAIREILHTYKDFAQDSSGSGYTASYGDLVVLDLHGKIDGKPFGGGTVDSMRFELIESNKDLYAPGLMNHLIGTKPKDFKTVELTLPNDFENKEVAGQSATFELYIKEVLRPSGVTEINEDFAKRVGFDSVDQLKQLIEEKVKSDFQVLGRLKTKHQLFTAMDERYQFDVPAGMLDMDFDAMWQEVKKQLEDPSNTKSEEELKDAYRKIAGRRVRLGLILANIARENEIEVTDQELQQAALIEALQKPDANMDFYKNKDNLERLRGPLLEEKVVDFILNNKVNVTEKDVTSEEFVRDYLPELQATAA